MHYTGAILEEFLETPETLLGLDLLQSE